MTKLKQLAPAILAVLLASADSPPWQPLMDPTTVRDISIHEAGHAVVAYFPADWFILWAYVGRTHGGFVNAISPGPRLNQTSLWWNIAYYMGGVAAENLFLGGERNDASGDFDNAALNCLGLMGLQAKGEKLSPPWKVGHRHDGPLTRGDIMAEVMDFDARVLRKHAGDVRRAAGAFKTHRVLTHLDFMFLFEPPLRTPPPALPPTGTAT